MTASLATSVAGPADAPVVVLLHSIMTASAMWTPQRALWASRFRVVAVDLPGHGDSPALAGSPGFGDYAEAVAGTLAGLGIDRGAVVGLSFGAMIALRLAADRPDLVTRLVLANGAASTPPAVAAAWRDRTDVVAAHGMASQVAPTLGRWFTPGFAATAPLTLGWIAGLIERTSAQGFEQAAAAIAALDQTALLDTVACPTLVVAGAHDSAIPPATSRAMADRLPRGDLVTLDAAHLSSVEQPVAFAEAVGSFLVSER